MRTLLTLVALLTAQFCFAGGIAATGDPGLSVCWAWNDPDDTVIDATPGVGNGAAVYAVEDAEIAAAGLDAGTWIAIPYVGSAGSFDPEVNERLGTAFIPQHRWSGTATITDADATASEVWAEATRTITGGTITTYTGNTPQTGDAFARIGAPTGASISVDLLGIASSSSTAATNSTTAATQATTAATQATAANTIVGSGTHGNAALKTLVDAKASQTSVDGLPTAADNVTALLGTTLTDTGAGKAGRALYYQLQSFASSGVFSEAALAEAPSGGGGGTSQPRINRKPDPGFTIKVSRRTDGTYKCTSPIRLTAGAVQDVYVFVDMSPLFGAENFVQTVGTATVSEGSITEGDDKGPRDTYAVLELDGTADDNCEVTVPVTMTSGTTVPVVFDVEVLE